MTEVHGAPELEVVWPLSLCFCAFVCGYMSFFLLLFISACADYGGAPLPASLSGVSDLGKVLGLQKGAGRDALPELLASPGRPKDSGRKGVQVLPVLPPRASPFLVRCFHVLVGVLHQ